MSIKEEKDDDKRRRKERFRFKKEKGKTSFLERTTRKSEETFRNERLLAHAGAILLGFLLQFPHFLLRLPALAGMPLAEAVHPDGFDAEAGAVLA